MQFRYLVLALLLPGLPAWSAPLLEANLDKQHRVHLLADGKPVPLHPRPMSDFVLVSSDGTAAAWLLPQGARTRSGRRRLSDELVVYVDGKTASIRCQPFIRDFWFPAIGGQVAIDCGGLHFAGIETLYDLHTMEELASFHQAEVPMERRPAWSNSGLD